MGGRWRVAPQNGPLRSDPDFFSARAFGAQSDSYAAFTNSSRSLHAAPYPMVGLFLMVNQGEVLLIVTLILPPNESGSVKVVKCLCAALVIIVAGDTMLTPVPT